MGAAKQKNTKKIKTFPPTTPIKKNQYTRLLLLTVSFLEGGVVMAVELLGAKMVAPYYGTSLYVWASVLGVTLGALALGYFLGGVASFRYKNQLVLPIILIVGAFFVCISPSTAPKIMYLTESLGVRLGSFLSVLLFLLPPLTLMGMVSPIIIQMLSTNEKQAGKSAGTVYAISTIGGIVATFLFGFFIIPFLGIKFSAYLATLILILAASTLALVSKKYMPILVSVLILFIPIFSLSKSNVVDSEYNIVYQSSGILGEWTVLDSGAWQEDNEQVFRKLILNGIDQTFTQKNFEPLSIWTYPHQLAAYASIKPPESKALLLGMGGGSVLHDLIELEFKVDAVELDERIKHIDEKYFGYDPSKSNLIIDDARHYLNETDEKYDVVIFDLLSGEVQPNHVFTVEGFNVLKKCLNQDGLVLINFQGTFDMSNPKHSLGPRSVYKTLEHAGFHVYHFQSDNSFDGSLDNDVIFISSLVELNEEKVFNNVRFNDWFSYFDFCYEDLISHHTIPTSDAYLLTDDKPQLELLNSQQILEWRKNKISQNSRIFVEKGLPLY